MFCCVCPEAAVRFCSPEWPCCGSGGAGLGWAEPWLDLFSSWEAGKQGRSSGWIKATLMPGGWIPKQEGPWDGSCSSSRGPHRLQPSQLHCWGFSLPTAVQGEGENCFYTKLLGKLVPRLGSLWVFLWLRSLWHKAWSCLLSGTH